MLAKKAFFSFLRLTGPTKHQVFNEYHQLDHRPANLALPGVVWGDRESRATSWDVLDTAAVESKLLDSPLRPIEPWQWDWFG